MHINEDFTRKGQLRRTRVRPPIFLDTIRAIIKVSERLWAVTTRLQHPEVQDNETLLTMNNLRLRLLDRGHGVRQASLGLCPAHLVSRRPSIAIFSIVEIPCSRSQTLYQRKVLPTRQTLCEVTIPIHPPVTCQDQPDTPISIVNLLRAM